VSYQVLDVGWGAVFGVILPLGLFAQLRRPQRRIGSIQQTAVVALALAVSGAAGAEWRYLALRCRDSRSERVTIRLGKWPFSVEALRLAAAMHDPHDPSKRYPAKPDPPELDNWLRSRGATKDCPACGSNHWRPPSRNLGLVVIDDEGHPIMSRAFVVSAVVCSNCAFVRLHAPALLHVE
jgi:hypothetical protein